MRRLLTLVLSLALAAPLVARADGGILLVAKGGVARPFGDVGNGQKLVDFVEWAFPLEAQLQFRVAKQLKVGGYGRYAPTTLATACDGCVANDLGFGAVIEYRFGERLEGGGWIGAFAGYELLKSEADAEGGGKDSSTLSGFEGGVSAGLDYEVGGLTLGPYVSLSFGSFSKVTADGGGSTSIADKGLHGLFGGGVRLALLF